jgi:hypothetical protein
VKNTAKTMMLGLVALSITFCAFVSTSAYKTRTDATARLNEFRELGTSKNPTASFASLRRKYGSKLRTIEGCTQQLCQYEMSLSNESISTFHVAPYTEMNVWFTVYEGSLQWAMLEYRTALRGPNSPVVRVHEGMCAHGCGVRFDVNPHGTTQQMWNGLVSFDTRATTQQRNAALAVNLECLARIGGCKDIIDLLPTVWTRNGGLGTISSRLVGLSQQLEESHGFPSPEDF